MCEGREETMYIYTRKAYYHETDQMGIIHHSNYVKWMEEARIGCMRAMGLNYRAMEEMGVISPVVDISVRYKKSVYFDDEVQVYVFVEKYNSVRLELRYEIRNKNGELCTEASSRNCFTKDGVILSLKKAMPELDARIREYMEKQ